MSKGNNDRAIGGTDEDASMICVKSRVVLMIVSGIFIIAGVFHIVNSHFYKMVEDIGYDITQSGMVLYGVLMLLTLFFFQTAPAYCVCSICGMLMIVVQVTLACIILFAKTILTNFLHHSDSSTTNIPKTDSTEVIILGVVYTINVILYMLCIIGFCQLSDVCGRGSGGGSMDVYAVEGGEWKNTKSTSASEKEDD